MHLAIELSIYTLIRFRQGMEMLFLFDNHSEKQRNVLYTCMQINGTYVKKGTKLQ